MGFKRVSYFDNELASHLFTDIDGARYNPAGELLLVNQNWYDPDVRKQARDVDLKLGEL